MKQQSKKKYDGSFKREAVRMADESEKCDRQIERELGLYQGALRTWRNELAKDNIHAFPGTGHQKPLEEENRELRKELARTRRERDILKKAAAYFSMDAVRDLRS
jgi:transposase